MRRKVSLAGILWVAVCLAEIRLNKRKERSIQAKELSSRTPEIVRKDKGRGPIGIDGDRIKCEAVLPRCARGAAPPWHPPRPVFRWFFTHKNQSNIKELAILTDRPSWSSSTISRTTGLSRPRRIDTLQTRVRPETNLNINPTIRLRR